MHVERNKLNIQNKVEVKTPHEYNVHNYIYKNTIVVCATHFNNSND